MLKEFIHDAIDKFDLICFDIFDTMLLRPYLRPSDLFIQLDDEKFANKRRDAERRCRRRLGSKANLHDIYNQLPNYRSLESKEVAMEMEKCVLNPEMKEVYDFVISKGKKVAFVSDMYLNTDTLAGLLKSKGIDKWNGLYVSCDLGMNKSSGKLLHRVQKDIGVPAGKCVHIGNDISCDIDGAFKAGMYAFYYPKIQDRFFEENAFVKNFISRYNRFENSQIRLFMGALCLAWHLNRCKHGDSIWHKVGCMFSGVIAYIHALDIIDICKTRGKKRVLLTLRDAYIISKLADFMFKDIKYDCFYGSRNMMFHLNAALHGDMGKDSMDALAYFKSLNINPSETLLVDGRSWNKTLQRTLELFTGSNIVTSYGLMSDSRLGDSQTSISSLSEENCNPPDLVELHEFCCGSPDKSILKLDADTPIYVDSMYSGYESYREAVYDRLVEAAVDTAKILFASNVRLDKNDAESYTRHYMSDCSLETRQFFINQYKPCDPEGLHYNRVYWGSPTAYAGK